MEVQLLTCYLLTAEWLDAPPFSFRFHAVDIRDALLELGQPAIASALRGANRIELTVVSLDRVDRPVPQGYQDDDQTTG